MGNKAKTGLDFFPLEVNFFNDIKLRKLIKYQSGKAVAVYTHLLCNIYKDGYYLKWDKELPFIISEDTGFEEAYIDEVIKCCFKVHLLSEKMFKEKGVLTSAGIQKRYTEICARLKRKAILSEELVIDSEEIPIDSERMGINSEEMPTKEGKGKVKEKKRKEIPTLEVFLNYCKEVLKEKYSLYEFTVTAKYEAWVLAGWKDGNGVEIVNWKSKFKNTLPYLKTGPIQVNITERKLSR